MPLHLIGEGEPFSLHDRQFSELNKFCSEFSADITLENKNGQFWLHSDDPKERPIGIEIDQELERHEAFFKKSSLHKELLARAIGIKGSYRPRVLDLTGGLLGDTLLFLSFGCEVWTLERHPVVQFLIQSAMQNAKSPKVERLHFDGSDAGRFLDNLPEIDVIYFDPMFEDASEKSSPRKEMRIFRNIVGKDTDAETVFQKAKALGPKRLVIKRPRLSVHLGGKPSVEYPGKSTRYDVYFPVQTS